MGAWFDLLVFVVPIVLVAPFVFLLIRGLAARHRFRPGNDEHDQLWAALLDRNQARPDMVPAAVTGLVAGGPSMRFARFPDDSTIELHDHRGVTLLTEVSAVTVLGGLVLRGSPDRSVRVYIQNNDISELPKKHRDRKLHLFGRY